MITTRVNGTRFEQWAANELQGNNVAALLQAGAALTTFDGRGWLKHVDVPTAVVVTGSDRIVAPTRQLALARTIPGAQVFRVEGDHTVCATDPGRFVPVLSAACLSVARQGQANRRPSSHPSSHQVSHPHSHPYGHPSRGSYGQR